jgi:polysaccharide pyruvyl transferase WcaK-like protein
MNSDNVLRIFIDHSGHELLNYGDTSMLQTAVYRLKKIWPEAIIYVFSKSEKRLEKYCPGTIAIHPNAGLAGKNIYRLGIFPRHLIKKLPELYYKKIIKLEKKLYVNSPKIHKLFMTLRVKLRPEKIDVEIGYKYLSLIASSDVVLATGGGYLTDDFKRHACSVLETIEMAIEHGKITAFLGQGIGPVSEKKLEQQMHRILPNVDFISLREKRCGLPILLRLGVQRSKIVTTGDDAIELANRMRTSVLGDLVGINLRITSYSEVGSQIRDDVAKILRVFAKKQKTRLIPIPISFHRNGEDNRALEKIIPSADYKLYRDIRLDSSAQLIDRVSDCRVVVTGSYHAGVFALSQGIPVIGLAKSQYYKDKFQGLADQFGDGCKVLLLDDPNRNQILSATLENFWDHSSLLRPRLLDSANRQIEKGQRAYQRLPELVALKKARADKVSKY